MGATTASMNHAVVQQGGIEPPIGKWEIPQLYSPNAVVKSAYPMWGSKANGENSAVANLVGNL